MSYNIIKIRENAHLVEKCAIWFNSKWGIPKEAYLESMNECIKNEGAVPQWYVALEGEKIVGGLGVIENDFHNRPDLAPNVCAVYVEEEYRKQGIAGELLNLVVEDMKSYGVTPLYLLTDHTGFYERYDWEFFCYALGDGEEVESRMYIHK